MGTVELVSPLSPEDCAKRLREAIDPLVWRLWDDGSRPVIGRVALRSVKLFKRYTFAGSFQTVLRGTLSESGTGAVFRGSARMHPLVIGFMAAWLAFAIILGQSGPRVMFGVSLILVTGGVAVACIGRWLARDEKRFLVDFVAEVIHSSESRSG